MMWATVMIPMRTERKKTIPGMQGRLTLQRLDDRTDIQDDLTYEYYDASNRLKNVDGSVDENYRYDEIGNLTADVGEGIDSIAWTPYGKVRTVFKNDDSQIHFRYDAAGNRIAKITDTDTTAYVRDASDSYSTKPTLMKRFRKNTGISPGD